MRVDVPLLPLSVEFRRRPLRPLRPTIRGLMGLVAVAGVFLALTGELDRRHRAMIDHEIRLLLASRSGSTAYVPPPTLDWHAAEFSRHQTAFEQADLLLFVLVVMIGAVTAIAVIGRLAAWLAGHPSRTGPSALSEGTPP